MAKLGVMNELSGLEKVLQKESTHAKMRRCQVHVVGKVFAKMTRAKSGKWPTI